MFWIVLLVLVSIAFSTLIEDEKDINLKEDEILKLKADEEIKEKLGDDVQFTKIKDFGELKIIYANIGTEELKIITSNYNYDKKTK